MPRPDPLPQPFKRRPDAPARGHSGPQALVEAGRVLDIELVAHIVIGQQRFVSLKELLKWK